MEYNSVVAQLRQLFRALRVRRRENLGINVIIILKLVVKTYLINVLAGLKLLTLEFTIILCERYNKRLESLKGCVSLIMNHKLCFIKPPYKIIRNV